jgi:hypothetical protein
MSGQEGGFREAVARFSAEVDAAVTRARRAAGEAKAQTAAFRSGTSDMVAKVKRGQVRPQPAEITPSEARESATEFRLAQGLEVEELPDDDELVDRLPETEPDTEPEVDEPDDDDEYFSQHRILVRGSEESYRPERP